jgi:DNA polymerase-3 subunit beta
MKFSISSSTLLTHLQAVARVINTRNVLPVLDNVLFTLKRGKLKLTASDYQTTVTSSPELLSYEGSGAFSVAAKTIIDSLMGLPEQPLAFSLDEDTMTVSISFISGEYKVLGGLIDDYPQSKALSADADSFSIDSDVLLAGINHTLFATANDQIIPTRGGVYLDIMPDEVVFVVSDLYGFFLSANTSVRPGLRAGIILPRKPAALLQGLLPKERRAVEVRFDSEAMLFSFGDFELRCLLADVRYPNYQAVIPESFATRITLDRMLFVGALRRVAMFAEKGLIVDFRLSRRRLTLTAENPGYGAAAAEHIVCDYSGKTISLELAVDHLIDLLLTMTCDEVSLEVNASNAPILIRPVDEPADERRLCLIMPNY